MAADYKQNQFTLVYDGAITENVKGKVNIRGGPTNRDIWLSEISASMGDGNRLSRSRSNEKTPP